MENIRNSAEAALGWLYTADPKTLAFVAISAIAVFATLSIVFSVVIGSSSNRFVEKFFDHLRQMFLNSAVALLAIVTASFVLVKQSTIQIDNQTMERLRVIDATLTFKLDLILSGISRLYFTQAVLADLDAFRPAGRPSFDLQALQGLSSVLNLAFSDLIAPTIAPADIPGLAEAFSLRSTANSPFLYAYLASETAEAIAIHDRKIASGMTALATDLAAVNLPEIWTVLARDETAKVSDDERKRRNRVSKHIEKLKMPAVQFAWFICEYKAAVALNLDQEKATSERSRYQIAVKSDARPSKFLIANRRAKGEQEDCSSRVLRSIMLSYNPIVAKTKVFDFLEDVYGLAEREMEVEKAINQLP